MDGNQKTVSVTPCVHGFILECVYTHKSDDTKKVEQRLIREVATRDSLADVIERIIETPLEYSYSVQAVNNLSIPTPRSANTHLANLPS